jgi:RNA polymerase sigma-70 factor (ECF subfamily)
VRAWLYRIATNLCLNALRARSRRPQQGQTVADSPAPTRLTEPVWVQPYPDLLLEEIPDRSPEPAARYEARESIELAFIVALQRLPPRQRTALVLRDVLGFRTAEVADVLDTGEASVKGAVQRAREALRDRLPDAERERAPRPNSDRERQLAGRFANAVESGDIDEVVALLTDGALLTMPPQPLEYQGHEAIAAFLRYRAELRGAALRVVPTRANTQPAFGCYLPDAHAPIARPYGLIVLTLEGDAIAAITWLADTGLFRHFGLPRTLPNLLGRADVEARPAESGSRLPRTLDRRVAVLVSREVRRVDVFGPGGPADAPLVRGRRLGEQSLVNRADSAATVAG